MMDTTIFIKDRVIALVKDLREGLNATDEQMLLGLRGALVGLEKECQQEWDKLQLLTQAADKYWAKRAEDLVRDYEKSIER